MTKIQLESGPSSSATHRITQPSTTLNRRYVGRPTNKAIEEAARSASNSRSSSDNSAPSRLVNLRIHNAELEAARRAEEAERLQASQMPVLHNVVEFGSADPNIEEQTSIQFDSGPQLSTPTTPLTPPDQYYNSSLTPTFFQPSLANAEYQQQAPDFTQIVPEEATFDDGNLPALPTSTNLPAFAEEDTAPTTPVQTAEIDTQALAMSIAADYAAASFGASMSSTQDYGLTEQNFNNLTAPQAEDTYASGSIDAIARAASEAIASIRVATEPSEVAEQVASLKAFAESIKSDPSMPEMAELGDTIEKFVAVAMKSTKAKEEAKAKPKISLTSKANRAAAKVTKSSAKIMAASRAKQASAKKASPTPRMTARTRIATPASRTAASPRIASKPTKTATLRRAADRETLTDEDQILRRALRSVASMDNKNHTNVRRQPAIKRKKRSKSFALAFFCAIACVAAVIYFVGTNIPDISVRVAAMQTGVEASYPSYVPRDFSLSNISSENGKITIIFEGPEDTSFTLVEEKSSWDSSTLLRNYVEPTWQGNYTTTHEQGITIYISGSNAAWVNGGVLYKISCDDNVLTKKQLRNIVTSM